MDNWYRNWEDGLKPALENQVKQYSTSYMDRAANYGKGLDGQTLSEAVLAKRLDQIDRRMTRLERDLGISVETLAVFVRFWLTTTPSLPEPAAQAARAKAAERYESFVTALGRRLAKGPKLRQEISEDIAGSDGSRLPQ